MTIMKTCLPAAVSVPAPSPKADSDITCLISSAPSLSSSSRPPDWRKTIQKLRTSSLRNREVADSLL